MTTVTRALWLNAETEKAVMVGLEPYGRHASNAWLAKSMITIDKREAVPNPNASPDRPHVTAILGTMVRITAPDHVFRRAALDRDATELSNG